MKGGVVLCIFIIFAMLSRTLSQENPDNNSVVYTKRAALLLDRILVAIHRALEEDGEDNSSGKSNNWRPPGTKDEPGYSYEGFPGNEKFPVIKGVQRPQPRVASRMINNVDLSQIPSRGMRLQQRDESSGTTVRGNIWRCYFNAVTCF